MAENPITFTTHIGGRGGTSDILDINTLNAKRVMANLVKIDAGTIGQVFAINLTLKSYQYRANLLHDDVPQWYVEMRASDVGANTVAHEETSGAAITKTANGLFLNGPGAARFGPSFASLLGTASVTDAATAKSPLKFAEQNAQPWTLEFWINRSNNTLASEVYIETNTGITSFIVVQVNTNGTILINRTNGGGAWTSPIGSPIGLNAWHHIALVYSAAGATNQMFIDGVSAGAATASVRGGPFNYTGESTVVNRNLGNQYSISQVAAYQNVLFVADDALRHFNDLNTDLITGNFVGTTAAIALGGTAGVMFTNDIAPSFYTGPFVCVMPMTPGCRIQTTAGIYLAEVTIWYEEG